MVVRLVMVLRRTPRQIAVFTFSSYTATRLNIVRVSGHSGADRHFVARALTASDTSNMQQPSAPPPQCVVVVHTLALSTSRCRVLTCHAAVARPTCERSFFHRLQTRVKVQPAPQRSRPSAFIHKFRSANAVLRGRTTSTARPWMDATTTRQAFIDNIPTVLLCHSQKSHQTIYDHQLHHVTRANDIVVDRSRLLKTSFSTSAVDSLLTHPSSSPTKFSAKKV